MSMPTAARTAGKRARMSSQERRDQILAAARTVFAEDGFQATTDQVARAAGVSQPYVVRLFGSKRDLFLAVYRDAGERVLAAFRAVPAGPDAGRRMGMAYDDLVADRDLLRVLMHGFIAGADGEVGALARHVLGEVYRTYVDRTGGTPEAARAFVATGMLINVLVAVDAPAHAGEDEGIDSLLAYAVTTDGRAAAGAATAGGGPDGR